MPVGRGNVAIAMSAVPASSGAVRSAPCDGAAAQIAVEQQDDVGVLDALRAEFERGALAVRAEEPHDLGAGLLGELVGVVFRAVVDDDDAGHAGDRERAARTVSAMEAASSRAGMRTAICTATHRPSARERDSESLDAVDRHGDLAHAEEPAERDWRARAPRCRRRRPAGASRATPPTSGASASATAHAAAAATTEAMSMRPNTERDAAQVVAADAPTQQERERGGAQREEHDVGDGQAVDAESGPRADAGGEHDVQADLDDREHDVDDASVCCVSLSE